MYPGSYLSEAEADETLLKFYIRVRPWGFWGPIRKKAEERFPEFQVNTNFKMDMFNVVIGIIWQTSLVAAPIFLVIHEYALMAAVMIVIFVTTLILKFTWWDNLEKIAGDSIEKKYKEMAERV